MNKNSTYRRDIDGLRALAIISVIIFHFMPSLAPGGYIGVDIFFVISGFLITGIILKECENNEFSYQKFYIRRIRRIFPALFFMLFCSFVAAFLMLSCGDLTWFSKAMHYSSLQISNFFFQRVTDYFNQGRDHFAPLLHTWSLGVEEQFYLLAPAIIASLLKWKKDKKFPFFALLFLSIISLCLSQYLLKQNQKIAFFSIASRFFELGIGCLLAFFGKKNLSAIVSNFASISGIAAIASSFFLINYANFPGFAALLPCLGAALIIFAGNRSENLISRILSEPLPVFIGKISYSLYLWHLPLIVFYQEYRGTSKLENAELATLLSLLFLISYCSWRFVEQPFRKKIDAKNYKKTFIIAASIALIFASAYPIAKKTNGFSFRLAKSDLLQGEELDQYATHKPDEGGKTCGIAKKNVAFPKIEECVIGKNKNDFEVALFGDSHAGHYSNSVISWAKQRNLSTAAFYFFACVPLLDDFSALNNDKRCHEYRQEILKILHERKNLKYVFLGSSWFEHKNADESYRKEVLHHVEETAKIITSLGKKVIILGRIPDFDLRKESSQSPIKCIELGLTLLQKIFPKKLPDCTKAAIEQFHNQQLFEEGFKKIAATHKNVFFFSAFGYFCDEKNCYSALEGKLLYADGGHLNNNGSQHLIKNDFTKLKVN